MFFYKRGCVVELLVCGSYGPGGARGALIISLGQDCRGRSDSRAQYGGTMVGGRSTEPPGSRLGFTAVIRNRPFPASSNLAAQMYPGPPPIWNTGRPSRADFLESPRKSVTRPTVMVLAAAKLIHR